MAFVDPRYFQTTQPFGTPYGPQQNPLALALQAAQSSGLAPQQVAQADPTTATDAYSGPDASAIEYRKTLAKALMERANKPLEQGRMAGGFVVPINPLEGLGKLAQTYVAGRAEKKALEQEKTYKDATTNAMIAALGQKDIPSMMNVLRGAPSDAVSSMLPTLAAARMKALEPKQPPMAVWQNADGSVNPELYAAEMGLKVKEGGAGPAAIQEYNFFQTLPPEKQRQFLEIKRQQQFLNLGGSFGGVNPISGSVDTTIPKTLPPQDTPAVRGAQAEATAAGKTAGEAQGQEAVKFIKAEDNATTLNEIEKLLPTATGSGAGQVRDSVANFFGHSTQGAEDAGQLDILAAKMTMQVPRMEGPQSDKDTALYKEAAGNFANRSLPSGIRMKGLEQMKRINNEYLPGGSKYNARNVAPQGDAPLTPAEQAELAKLKVKHGG